MLLAPEHNQLAAGLSCLNLALSAKQVQLLEAYLALFAKWNQAINLSAIRRTDEMIKLHLLDSLCVSPHLLGHTWLDVGTGGGLPGIPLAIAKPDCHFTLLDSAGKKTRFLHQVVHELALPNVSVVHARAESHKLNPGVDGVISRAFASLADMVQSTAHLLGESGRFYAMKGQHPEAELREIEKDYIVSDVIPLQVPGAKVERCLVVFHPKPQRQA